MADPTWDEAMAELIAVQRRFIDGDAAGIQRLYSHRDDVTVFGGFGGSERGWAEVGPRLAWAASHFSGGAYSQEEISATVGADVACLVSLERWSRPRPGGQGDEVFALRVTQVFRLEDGRWRLIHRHADPLIENNPPF
jgi:ketosteroid isomerase-like protein